MTRLTLLLLLLSAAAWAQRPYVVGVTGAPTQAPYGVWYTISFTVGDAQGWNTITSNGVLINSALAGVNACFILLPQNSNTFHLAPDDQSSWGPAYTMGSSTMASNSYCQIDAANSSYSFPNSTDVTANLRMRFLGPMIAKGTLSIWISPDDEGGGLGWREQASTVTVRSRQRLIITR